MFNTNPAYTRKINVAAEIADSAWLRGGLDAVQDELRSLRRTDADPVVIAEVERLYHKQCLRVLPPATVAEHRWAA